MSTCVIACPTESDVRCERARLERLRQAVARGEPGSSWSEYWDQKQRLDEVYRAVYGVPEN